MIIEDLIPGGYITAILEPSDLKSLEISDFKDSEIYGWIHGAISEGMHLYQYKLFQPHRYDDIKNKLINLFQEGIDALNNKKLIEAVRKAREISDVFEEEIR